MLDEAQRSSGVLLMMDKEGTIGIIGGTGNQGWGLALRWAAAGKSIKIGSRLKERADAAAQKIRDRLGHPVEATGMTNEELVATSDVLLLAVPFEGQAKTLTALRGAFHAGQLMIDCTVPLETAVGGSITRVLSVWAGSAAQHAARLVPAEVAVAAAFQNIPAYALHHPEEPVDCDVVVCADSAETRERVRPWVEIIAGCRFVDGGKLENARIVEALTALLIGIGRRHKTRGAGIRFTGI
jgi:8-hydroxy-5-deazaflavin:NADPH oxidoreductase